MRAAPTLETSGNADDYNVNYGGGNVACNAVPARNAGGTDVVNIKLSVASGPSAGEAVILEFVDGTASGFVAFSAEL